MHVNKVNCPRSLLSLPKGLDCVTGTSSITKPPNEQEVCSLKWPRILVCVSFPSVPGSNNLMSADVSVVARDLGRFTAKISSINGYFLQQVCAQPSWLYSPNRLKLKTFPRSILATSYGIDMKSSLKLFTQHWYEIRSRPHKTIPKEIPSFLRQFLI